MLNTMNLIWAFNFSPATDPNTGKAIPVDTHDYAKVSPDFARLLLYV
jgi:hypothetical protein